MAADEQVDILIVGGGLTGASLMLALAAKGYTIRLVDAKPLANHGHSDFDARSLALAPASVRILEMLNVWPLLIGYATAINTIHISEQGRFGRAVLHGAQKNPLGYVVEMQHIQQVLQQLVNPQHVIAPAQLQSFDRANGLATIEGSNGKIKIQARLIVAADGSDSLVRQFCHLPTKIKNYPQQAVAANIGLARSHHFCAYERFTATGPLAMLPMAGLRASLIWSLPPDRALQVVQMHEAEFLSTLQQAFGYRLGRFTKVGQRAFYPLRQVIMPQQIAWPVVFLGNAAHTLHPVAGQGFNLGLRDVAVLAQCIVKLGLNQTMLETYQQLRIDDQRVITYFTDGLIDLFGHQSTPLQWARGKGLFALDNSAWGKKLIARYAGGYAGVTPDLVCKIPLHIQEL